jgi:hypothetical protein
MTANVYLGKVLTTRGNTVMSNAYTGLLGEITFDTDLHTIRAHDGATAGGYIIPTMGNVNAAVTTANTAMKAYVDTQVLTNWVANAAAQSVSITDLYSNAATQSANLSSLNTTVVTLQSEINGIVTGTGFATNAQITAANAAISSTQANVAAANLAILGSNIGMQIYVDAAVTSLVSNAATQSNAISATNANVAAANSNIDHLMSVVSGLLSQPYIMANYHNWSANVITISQALDQLSSRINALDHLGQP